MKTLFELCKPRASVFLEITSEDVLNLTDLSPCKIDAVSFFEENYITDGMRTLLSSVFARFSSRGGTGLIRLTQAMGGGKTHNMIALGLLTQNPEYRKSIMPDGEKYEKLGKIRLAIFSGRESDAPLGIWGAIAEQLGRREMFSSYYSPLSAPGETAWINLLKGEPLLIMLDELPPYLENAKSKPIGNSDLSAVTATALANLFSALGKTELNNVCLVVSDLKATYESGSEIIRSTFKNLDNEINRSALNIEPVGSGSDDVYHILKKRLFEALPSNIEINTVALAYKDEVMKAKQMGFTNISPDSIYAGIKDSYPFHPSIRDLYARFKENSGFQQTRGLIRLMRLIVAGLYSGEIRAKKDQLIGVFDFDLNNAAMHTAITQIKPELTNAIAHDIAANGKAVAEQIDAVYGDSLVSDVSKLILVSSLANIPNALLGLSLPEVIGNLCRPGRDIAGLKKALDEFQMRAWYLEHDKNGKLLFKNVKNMIAELHSLVESFDNESVRSSTLKVFLTERFKPDANDCYQNLAVFPAIDEIDLVSDKVTLVLFEPFTGTGLHPELERFYSNATYKNRVMFLSGSRDTMNRLYDAAKQLKAIDRIIANMKDDKVPEDNQQLLLAHDTRIKKINVMLSAAQQTFTMLYYPMQGGIRSAEFNMQFKNNNYNGEEQVRNILIEKQKFSDKAIDDTLRQKCEQRLFTMKEMRFADIKYRAATETSWGWAHPKTLDDLYRDCISKDLWRERGEYIEKGPFPKDPTSITVSVIGEDEATGKVRLRLKPLYGDMIYYEVGSDATEASLKVDNPTNFETGELALSFLCVDTVDDHPTGEAVAWVRDIKIKHKIIEKADGKYMILQTHNGINVKYTTDGSDPKTSGGIYDGEFKIPESTAFVQFVGELNGKFYDPYQVKIEKGKEKVPEVDKTKALLLAPRRRIKGQDTSESYALLAQLKKHSTAVRDVGVILRKENKNDWIELNLSENIFTEAVHVETVLDVLKNTFARQDKVNIEIEFGRVQFATGQSFFDFLSERRQSLTDYPQEEIVQK